MKMTPKARALLRKRRLANRVAAVVGAHRRQVQWFGSGGLRCWDCQDIPWRSWERGE